MLLCFGSDSYGNCWLYKNEKESILIDCGIPLKSMLMEKEFDLSQIKNCLITHSHKDHSYSKKDFEYFNVNIIDEGNSEVGVAIKTKYFDILPLPATHKVKCNGYLIKDNVNNKRIFYLVDTTTIPKIGKVKYDYFMIEANYDEDIVLAKKEQEYDMKFGSYEDMTNMVSVKDGWEHHLSLQKVEKYLSENNYEIENLIICHTSNRGNIKESEIIEKLKKYAKNIYVAKKGMKLE